MSELLSRMADFDLTPDQREIRRTVRAFAEREILPHVERHEKEERYPIELVQKLAPLGLLGPLIPERYGGSFSDVVSYGIVCEELARIDWVLASVVSVGNSLAASSILKQARLLVYRLGRMKDAGVERASMEASLAKLVASEAAVDNALDGIQIFGAYGLAEGYEIGRLLLEAKALTLGEGTSELHTKLIAEYALGMRRG